MSDMLTADEIRLLHSTPPQKGWRRVEMAADHPYWDRYWDADHYVTVWYVPDGPSLTWVWTAWHPTDPRIEAALGRGTEATPNTAMLAADNWYRKNGAEPDGDDGAGTGGVA